MRKKKELPVINDVVVTDISAEGNAVGRSDNLVIFMPLAVPGDVVDVKITRKRKNYAEGRPIVFHEYSKDRVEPVCSHFGVCGGCKLQNLNYSKQLYFKEKIVRENLTRIGKVNLPEISPIIGSADELLYRNKLEYTFSSKRWFTDEMNDSAKAQRSCIEILNHVFLSHAM